MVEIFKTNVETQSQADLLTDHLSKAFVNYQVNFDLEDCDNILRVEYRAGLIDCCGLIDFLMSFGCIAEQIRDEAGLIAG